MPSRYVKLEAGASQLIYALAHMTGMNLWTAHSELADNALDAGAKRVDFDHSNALRRMVVTDDGRGTSNVRAIVTPYKHGIHETVAEHQSGCFGIGGTNAQTWICGGQGRTEVVSRTRHLTYAITADFARMRSEDDLGAEEEDPVPNDTGATGTTITVSNCIEVTRQQMGKSKGDLAWWFTPALRRGKQIFLNLDGDACALKPYPIPAHDDDMKFQLEVDGMPVHGRCCLVKSGVSQRARGWAVAFGHRFVDVFREPAGDRQLDFGRLYAEVYLSRQWKDHLNINKNAFVVDPAGLWEQIGIACAPILDRIEEEGNVIELEEANRTVQEILDAAMGLGGWKAVRLRDADGEEGAVKPTNNGSAHKDASRKQEGSKPGGGPRPRTKITFEWAGAMDWPYEVRPGQSRVAVILNKSHPFYEKYQGVEAAPFLADHILHLVAADVHAKPFKYQSMFQSARGQDISEIFQYMLSKVVSIPALIA